MKVVGESVEATFYLADVPAELEFQRQGVKENYVEYTWDIYVDVDGDSTSGFTTPAPWLTDVVGVEYILSARSYKGNEAPRSVAIDAGRGIGVQTDLWKFLDKGSKAIARAKIKADADANTITLSVNIPGVSDSSVFYYRTFDINPGGDPQTSAGSLAGRVVLE